MKTKTLVLLSLVGAATAAGAFEPGRARADVPAETSEAAGAGDQRRRVRGVHGRRLSPGERLGAGGHPSSRVGVGEELARRDDRRQARRSVLHTGDLANCDKVVDALLSRRAGQPRRAPPQGQGRLPHLAQGRSARLPREARSRRGEFVRGPEDSRRRVHRPGDDRQGRRRVRRGREDGTGAPAGPVSVRDAASGIRPVAEAEEALSEAVRLKPDFSEAAVGLAEIMVERGGTPRPSPFSSSRSRPIRRTTARSRSSPTSTSIRASTDKAIRLLEEQNRRSALPNEGLLLLGRLYYEVKDYDEALAFSRGCSRRATPRRTWRVCSARSPPGRGKPTRRSGTTARRYGWARGISGTISRCSSALRRRSHPRRLSASDFRRGIGEVLERSGASWFRLRTSMVSISSGSRIRASIRSRRPSSSCRARRRSGRATNAWSSTSRACSRN